MLPDKALEFTGRREDASYAGTRTQKKAIACTHARRKKDAAACFGDQSTASDGVHEGPIAVGRRLVLR